MRAEDRRPGRTVLRRIEQLHAGDQRQPPSSPMNTGSACRSWKQALAQGRTCDGGQSKRMPYEPGHQPGRCSFAYGVHDTAPPNFTGQPGNRECAGANGLAILPPTMRRYQRRTTCLGHGMQTLRARCCGDSRERPAPNTDVAQGERPALNRKAEARRRFGSIPPIRTKQTRSQSGPQGIVWTSQPAVGA